MQEAADLADLAACTDVNVPLFEAQRSVLFPCGIPYEWAGTCANLATAFRYLHRDAARVQEMVEEL